MANLNFSVKMNMGGASDRPLLHQIWENVDAKLQSKGAMHHLYVSMGVTRMMARKMCGPPKSKTAT